MISTGRFTKQVVKAATGARRDLYVDLLYDSLINGANKYNFGEPDFLAFLAQIGHETGGLLYMEELASGSAYEGRADLGNTNPGDGVLFKGRTLIQVTGRSNYRRGGAFINKPVEQNPTSASPVNSDHKRGLPNPELYSNAVELSLWFWKKGSAWGDLSIYSSEMSIESGVFYNSTNINVIPDKNTDARRTPFNLRPLRPNKGDLYGKKGSFYTDYIGLSRTGEGKNLYLFELITLGINGGYNGFRDRIEKYEAGRKLLLANNFVDPNRDSDSGRKDRIEPTGEVLEPTGEVLEQEGVSEQADTTKRKNNTQENGGLRTILKPTINITPIVFNAENIDKQTIENIGSMPFIWLNDIQLDSLTDFKLHSMGGIPTVEISFFDTYRYFDTLRFPNDDVKMRLLIGTRSEILRPIFMEFKVYTFVKMGDNSYKVVGIINNNKLLSKESTVYEARSSFEALEEFCKLSGFGYKSNLSGTNDSMNWINPGNRNKDFLKSISIHSYLNDNTFLYSYIDYYYNLVFVDVESILSQGALANKGVTTVELNRMYSELVGGNKTEATNLYLTNDNHASSTTKFIIDYRIINNSLKTHLDNGYQAQLSYYDTNNLELLKFNIKPIVSDKLNTLKGSEDEEFFNLNTRYVWGGTYDTDNVHENYIYAHENNSINLSEISKIVMEVDLPKPNFNLYIMQNITVLLINQGSTVDRPLYNTKLSGDWLIVDIRYVLTINGLIQKVALTRRDLGFSPEELGDK